MSRKTMIMKLIDERLIHFWFSATKDTYNCIKHEYELMTNNELTQEMAELRINEAV